MQSPLQFLFAWAFPRLLVSCRWYRLAPVVALASCSPYVQQSQTGTTPGGADLPNALGDPLEPVNRSIWAFNHSVLRGVIRPTSTVYRKAVPKPVRRSINHFGRNICVLGRVANESLQGRWKDVGHDSLRFLTNTTVGVGGLFDPATRWKIPKPNADFGQTLRAWGWQPSAFIMLPILGPSDEASLTGSVVDELAEPWNYSEPLRLASYGVTFNRISEFATDALLKIQVEADPYSVLKLAWSQYVQPQAQQPFPLGPRDQASLETLSVAAMALQDSEFGAKSKSLKVPIAATGRCLPCNLWKQPHPAPLVYVAPGIGSHRLSTTTLAIAEGLFQRGFSVVATSSVFHSEFMETASTAKLPGHPISDANDLLNSLTAIDQLMQTKYPGQFTSRALVGCSMGAYQTLLLATKPLDQDGSTLRFDRYVAINPPIDLHHGVRTIDRMFRSPDAWPVEIRQKRINHAVQKAAALALMPPKAGAIPPFDTAESQYLIGLTFRYVLRDAIFSSQFRHNQGVLKTRLSQFRREPAYQEILAFSYADYLNRLLVPAFATDPAVLADFKRFGSLRNLTPQLRKCTTVRVITNRNDFLLTDGDLDWLTKTFGPAHCKVFATGGHLGNLATPEMRQVTAGFLEDLK